MSIWVCPVWVCPENKYITQLLIAFLFRHGKHHRISGYTILGQTHVLLRPWFRRISSKTRSLGTCELIHCLTIGVDTSKRMIYKGWFPTMWCLLIKQYSLIWIYVLFFCSRWYSPIFEPYPSLCWWRTCVYDCLWLFMSCYVYVCAYASVCADAHDGGLVVTAMDCAQAPTVEIPVWMIRVAQVPNMFKSYFPLLPVKRNIVYIYMFVRKDFKSHKVNCSYQKNTIYIYVSSFFPMND